MPSSLLTEAPEGTVKPYYIGKHPEISTPAPSTSSNGIVSPSRTSTEPQVSGFMKPTRFEGEVNNLEVQGTIPENIKGTFYRVMPEPQFPAIFANDPVSLH